MGPYQMVAAAFVIAALSAIVLAAMLPGRPASVSAQQGELIIEILPGGFNPPECTLNRNARLPIRFLNMDTKPRRIVVDEIWSPEPGAFARDTGWLEPGEKDEQGWTFGEIQDLTYHDYDDPTLTGRIIVPLSNTATTVCDLEEPGTVTAPCSRVISKPRGCGILPKLATDGPLE